MAENHALPQRIPPRPSSDWDESVPDAMAGVVGPRAVGNTGKTMQESLAEAARTGGRTSNSVGTMAWHPPLMKAFYAYLGYLWHSSLPDRLSELLIMRTSFLRRSEYQWSVHVRLGRALGVTDEQIAAVAEGPDSPVWSPFEAAVLRAADEICEDHYISDETWSQLSVGLSRQQLMDLMFIVGTFDLLSMALNTFGIELEVDAIRFPAETR